MAGGRLRGLGRWKETATPTPVRAKRRRAPQLGEASVHYSAALPPRAAIGRGLGDGLVVAGRGGPSSPVFVSGIIVNCNVLTAICKTVFTFYRKKKIKNKKTSRGVN